MILMQQLDAASRMMESTGYMQYAPFIGTPSVSKEASRGTTPLYRTVCAMVDKINGVWSGADKPPWSSSVTFEDVRRCAKCAEGLANEAARQTSTSYFKATVMLMERFIEPLRREGATRPPFCPCYIALARTQPLDGWKHRSNRSRANLGLKLSLFG